MKVFVKKQTIQMQIKLQITGNIENNLKLLIYDYLCCYGHII
jgi:hypothetical protein